MPFFPIPGLGGYRVQPVAVEDVAEIAVWAAEQSDNVTVDAAGPDTVTYGELVEGISIAVGRRPRFVYMSPRLTLWAGNIVASRVRDVMLTKEELQGLMEELLISLEKPRGTRRMDNWLLTNAETLGRTYASELDRHWR
jgi:NADH dehydrogenase